MSDEKSVKKENNPAMLWTGAVVLAVLIIGAAVLISQARYPENSGIEGKQVVTAQAFEQAPEEDHVSAEPFSVPENNSMTESELAALQAEVITAEDAASIETSAEADVPGEEVSNEVPDVPVPEEMPQEEPRLELTGKETGSLAVQVPAISAETNRLPLKYSCFRSNVSPPVTWSGAPGRTKSFVLLMEQMQSGQEPYIYWVVYNIPGSSQSLEENLPAGPELGNGIRYGKNDHGVVQYTGPCDPVEEVSYRIRLVALDTVLDLPAGASRGELVTAMEDHIVQAAETSFTYKKD